MLQQVRIAHSAPSGIAALISKCSTLPGLSYRSVSDTCHMTAGPYNSSSRLQQQPLLSTPHLLPKHTLQRVGVGGSPIGLLLSTTPEKVFSSLQNYSFLQPFPLPPSSRLAPKVGTLFLGARDGLKFCVVITGNV